MKKKKTLLFAFTLIALSAISINANAQSENIDMNININVSGTMVEEETPTKTTTTSTKTTTTTTKTTSTSSSEDVSVSCSPMTVTEFNSAKSSIEAKTFADSKMTIAKQIVDNNCFSSDQVKSLMGLFTYEEQKLDIAKYCYTKTSDPKNYYKVNDAFTFESSISELQQYIKSK